MRTFRTFGLLFLLFQQSPAFGQWSKTFDLQNGNELGDKIMKVPDGLLVWCRGLCNDNQQGCEGLMKFDFEGNLLWKKVEFYDSLLTTHFQAATLKGDTVLVNVKYTYQPLKYSVLAFDLNGNNLGRYDYSVDSGISGSHWARDIAALGDRIFVTFQYKDQATQKTRSLLRALDTNGEQVWEVEPSASPAFPTLASNVEATPDGGAVLIFADKFPSFPLNRCSVQVVKYDSLGAPEWTTQLPETTGGSGDGVFITRYPADGGYLGLWEIDTFGFFYEFPSIIFKLDAFGQLEWQKLDITPLYQNYLQAFPRQNGDIIICGLDSNLAAPSPDSLYDGGYVRCFAPNGETRWERRIFDITKGYRLGVLYDGLELDNGNLVFCGEMQDTLSEAPYPQNVWLLMLDSMGCILPDCGTNQFLLNAGEAQRPPREEVFAAFPTLFGDELHLGSVLGRRVPPGAYRAVLFDVQGRQVLKKAIDPHLLTTLNTAELSPGPYVLTIQNASHFLQSIRLIKQ